MQTRNMGVSASSDTRLFTANTQLVQGILLANQTYSLKKGPIYKHMVPAVGHAKSLQTYRYRADSVESDS